MARTQTEPDPDRRQAGGWQAEGGGSGPSLHVKETMLVKGVMRTHNALVVRLYADFWTAHVEPWEG